MFCGKFVLRTGGNFQFNTGIHSESVVRIVYNILFTIFLVLSSPLFGALRHQIVALAAKTKLPAIYEGRRFVEAGGLISYGPDTADVFRRAAVYVDKILKGAKPADLPVERPTKFELVINLKTAKDLGVAIPQPLLQRADDVIH
jgi:putative ABC transport system substrate-binding protein